jgi:hypothetical protein
MGPDFGGTVITIDIFNFPVDLATKCIFGTREYSSLVNLIGSSRIICSSPSHVIGIVQLSLLFEDQYTVEIQSSFAYYPAPSIVSLFPVVGPVAGGITVLVRGSNFLNTSTLLCSFGEIKVSARFLNNTALKCVSPMQIEINPMTNKFSVSLNGADFAFPHVSFRYLVSLDDTLYHPAIGPVLGRTNITFAVSDARIMLSSYCSINGNLIPIVSIDSNRVACAAPMVDSPGATEVLLLAADRSVVGLFNFVYFEDPLILTTQTLFVNENRGLVFIRGQSFARYSNIICVLESGQ